MAKRKFWTSDKLVAFVALIISLLSLFIFVRQTNIIEEQSHLSVMPYLMMETSNQGFDKIFQIDIVNHGVGPAIIESKKYVINGKTYEDIEFLDFLAEYSPNADSLKVINQSTVHTGLAIPSGGTRNVMRVGGDAKSYGDFLAIFGQLQADSLYYEIRYRSIYGDLWVMSSTNQVPEKIEEKK